MRINFQVYYKEEKKYQILYAVGSSFVHYMYVNTFAQGMGSLWAVGRKIGDSISFWVTK